MGLAPTDIATIIRRVIRSSWQGEVRYRDKDSGKLVDAYMYAETPDELANKIFERFFVEWTERQEKE